MEKIQQKSCKITTAGGDGSATGHNHIEATGFLLDVYVDWNDTIDTDVLTITDANGKTILATPAGHDDTLYNPRVHTHDHAGAETGLFEYFVLDGQLTLTVTASNALTDECEVTIRYLAL